MKNNWPTKKLSDVILDIKDGGTPSRKNPEYFGGDIYWCIVKDIKPQIYDTKEKLTRIGLEHCSAKVWPVDSIIISLGATIGQVGIAKVPTATKQGLSGIVVDKKVITPEFLFYILNYKKEYIQKLATGATIKEIRPVKLKELLTFPLPPLSEQKKIVKTLEEVFKKTAKAQENTEKNLQNSKELSKSYLQSVFTNPSTDWQSADFEKTIDKAIYTNKIQKNKFLESGKFPVVSQEKNLINGYWDAIEDVFKIKKPVTIFGDHTQIVKYIDFDFVLGADGVKILQPKDFLFPKFFYYLIKNINLKNLGYARHYRLLREKQVYYPKSLAEQKIISKRLDRLFIDVEKLKGNYEKKLVDIEEFNKSILKMVYTNSL